MTEQKKTKFIDPKYTEQHYNTSIFKGYLLFLKHQYGEVRARELLSELPLGWDYLYSDSNWVSETFSELFYEKISSIPGIPEDFSYIAGCLTMSKENLGPLQYWLMRLIRMETITAQSINIASKFVKVDKLEVLENSHRKFSFKFISNRKTKYLHQISENWRGNLESMPTLHGLEHGRCTVNKVDDYTVEFQLRWQAQDSKIRHEIKKNMPWLVSYSVLLLLAFSQGFGLTTLLVTTCLFALVLSHYASYRDNQSRLNESKVMANLIKDHEERYQELHANKVKLDRRYKESHLLRAVIERITQTKSSEDLISLTIKEIKDTLGYDRVVFMKHQTKTDRLVIHSTVGFDAKSKKIIRQYSIDLAEVTEKSFHMGNVFKDRSSILIPVTKGYVGNLSDEARSIIEMTNSQSFIACTVASERAAFGIMMVDYCESSKELTEDDHYIIQNLCNQLAILLDDASILEQEVRLRTTFQKFVPQEVIEQMTFDEVGGEKARSREVTILFTDIRGFVAKSEMFTPSEIVSALNYYFSAMNNIIYSHHGIVDKFIGDGLMAVFNAFGGDSEHQKNACFAALEMQKKLSKVNKEIAKMMQGQKLWEPITVGMGIHSGECIIGNVGSEQKMEFTAIGRTVNIASRLQDLTKKYQGIIISENVKQHLSSSVKVEELGSVDIRGVSKIVRIHKLVDLEGRGGVTYERVA